MQPPLTQDELIKMLRDVKKMGSISSTARYELIGDIDPWSPTLTDAEKLLVLRACRKSMPFFLWVLKRTDEVPPTPASDKFWGAVETIAMSGTAFHSLVAEQIRKQHTPFKGKVLTLNGWLFESGDMCVIASANGVSKTYKYMVHTAPVVITRSGARLIPSTLPPKHVAGLFDKEWKEHE